MARPRSPLAILLGLAGALALRGLPFVPGSGELPRGRGALARRARLPADVDRDSKGAGMDMKEAESEQEVAESRKVEISKGRHTAGERRGTGSWQWKPRLEHMDVFERGSTGARRPSAEISGAPAAPKKLTNREREVLRLPAIDEEKEARLAIEEQDRELSILFGPLGGWVFEKLQPRKWGPNGILMFKLMYLAFMWAFFMAVYPIFIDMLISLEKPW